jgi:hypothetical protein
VMARAPAPATASILTLDRTAIARSPRQRDPRGAFIAVISLRGAIVAAA